MRGFKSVLKHSSSVRSLLFHQNLQKVEIVPLFSIQPARRFHISRHLSQATCTYRNGFVVLTLPLPSRNENCEFILRPVSDNVKSLVTFVSDEDGGVDRIAVYSEEGTKISNSTPIDILIKSDFKLAVNDKVFHIEVPQGEILVPPSDDPLSNTKNLISQLYTDMRVQEYKDNRGRQIKEHLEALTTELGPLESAKAQIDARTAQRTNTLVWAGLGYMALQFGFLARLTWWEYSWDIMEPVTYFVTYGGQMIFYAYFVLTREDSNYPEIRNRLHLLSFYKSSKKQKFNVAEYNAKKETVARLENELRLLNLPPTFADLSREVEN